MHFESDYLREYNECWERDNKDLNILKVERVGETSNPLSPLFFLASITNKPELFGFPPQFTTTSNKILPLGFEFKSKEDIKCVAHMIYLGTLFPF